MTTYDDDDDFDEGQAWPSDGRGRHFGLTDKLIDRLLEDFEEHGAAAIAAFRKEKPAAFLQLIAKLAVPAPEDGREAESGMSEEEVALAIATVRRFVAAQKAEDAAMEAAEKEEEAER